MANDIAEPLTERFLDLWVQLVEPEKNFNPNQLLAHYTSLSTVELILRTKEIWFNNPLCMNDYHELRYGMQLAKEAIEDSTALESALGTPERAELFLKGFDAQYERFANHGARDVYVFCASAHESLEHDGKLAMWRGYGAEGSGAALVFNPGPFFQSSEPLKELTFGPVRYQSPAQIKQWYLDMADKVAVSLLNLKLGDEDLRWLAFYVFDAALMRTLFLKHNGFDAEVEWRFVYVHHRDVNQRLSRFRHYSVGANSVQPRLKLKLDGSQESPDPNVTLPKLLKQVLLGPSSSSALTAGTVKAMLEHLGYDPNEVNVRNCEIPFRRFGH